MWLRSLRGGRTEEPGEHSTHTGDAPEPQQEAGATQPTLHTPTVNGLQTGVIGSTSEIRLTRRFVAASVTALGTLAGVLGLMHLSPSVAVPASVLLALIAGLIWEPDVARKFATRIQRARRVAEVVVALTAAMTIAFTVGYAIRKPLDKLNIDLPNLGSSPSCVTSSAADRNAAEPSLLGAPRGAVLPLVTGRCNQQTELSGPGINFSGVGNFGLNGGGKIEIPASNWYTIGANSVVPASVTVTVDPVIHQDAVSFRRFQYLADLMNLFPQQGFCVQGLITARESDDIVVIGVIRNSSFTTLSLGGLHMTLTESPPQHVLGTTTLFTGGTRRDIPANSVYFFEARFAGAKRDTSPATDTYDFHWDSLTPAATSHCA